MLPSSRTSTGTTTRATSASRTAAGPSMVARSRPEPTCSARSSGRFGSPPHGATPELMMSTSAWLMSTACTRQPCEANCKARGRPILPEPMTAMVPTVPGAPTHGFAVTGVPWVQGCGSAVKEPPSMDVARPSGSVVRALITPPCSLGGDATPRRSPRGSAAQGRRRHVRTQELRRRGSRHARHREC